MTDPAPAPSPRASDQEREATADRLRAAASEGRLDPEELDDRMERAFAARTQADLALLTADLPSTAPARDPEQAWYRRTRVRSAAAGMVSAGTIATLIWLATGADGGYWPIWVWLGTGIALISTIGSSFGRDASQDDRRPSDRPRDDRT